MGVVNIKDLDKINRPKLGSDVPLGTFRLLRLIGMQEILGDSTGPTLYMVGKRVGKALNFQTIDDFILYVEKHKIGIPEIEEVDGANIIIRLQECMTCAGLPNMEMLFCHFESGFIAGVLETITGKNTKSTQTKSCSNGDPYCQFEVFLY